MAGEVTDPRFDWPLRDPFGHYVHACGQKVLVGFEQNRSKKSFLEVACSAAS